MIRPLNDIATIPLLGMPLVLWLGLVTFLMVLATAIYGTLLMKAMIKGKVSTHRYLAYLTIAIAIVHGSLAASLFL